MEIRRKHLAIAILVALAAISISLICSTFEHQTFPAPRGEHWLLLIAHPDDETMFFAPTLLFLSSMGVHLHLLCVTSGNSAGLGPLRRKELFSAASVYGIPSENVHFLDPDELHFRDGFHPWNVSHLSASIFDFLNRTKPFGGLVTFDGRGISDHPNHRDCFGGISDLHAKGKLAQIGIKWTMALESVAVWRKYTGLLDIIATKFLERNDDFTIYWIGSIRPFKAMEQHRSQLVWFRYLYMAFSRYIFINNLVPFA